MAASRNSQFAIRQNRSVLPRIWQHGATVKGGGPAVFHSISRTPEVVRR